MITLYDRNVLIEKLKKKGRPSQVTEGMYHLFLTDVERALDEVMEEDRQYGPEEKFGKISNGRSL